MRTPTRRRRRQHRERAPPIAPQLPRSRTPPDAASGASSRRIGDCRAGRGWCSRRGRFRSDGTLPIDARPTANLQRAVHTARVYRPSCPAHHNIRRRCSARRRPRAEQLCRGREGCGRGPRRNAHGGITPRASASNHARERRYRHARGAASARSGYRIHRVERSHWRHQQPAAWGECRLLDPWIHRKQRRRPLQRRPRAELFTMSQLDDHDGSIGRARAAREPRRSSRPARR